MRTSFIWLGKKGLNKKAHLANDGIILDYPIQSSLYTHTYKDAFAFARTNICITYTIFLTGLLVTSYYYFFMAVKIYYIHTVKY